MQFRIDCPCGEHHMAPEGAAGATFTCSCGRVIVVPSSSELRTRAGLPTNAVSPEFIVEHLLGAGEVPGKPTCVECGRECREIAMVRTECERATRQQSGGFSWPMAVLFLFVCAPMLIFYLWWCYFYLDQREVKEYGRDKIYDLPMRICAACKPHLSDASAIKSRLCKVEEYALLLEKFPAAKVSLHA